MKGDRRIERIYHELSVTERARLVLEDYKAGREPDQRLRWGMSDYDTSTFVRLVRKLQSLNERVSWLALSWESRLDEVEALRGWYGTLRLWGTSAWETALYLAMHDAEPITESERDRRVAELRAETMTVSELAEYLVHIEEDEGDEEFSEREWKKALREKEKALRDAIDSGVLRTVKRGRSRVVEMGPVYNWLGEEVPVPAEYGIRAEVVRDEEAEAIVPKREARARLQADLDRAPIGHGLQTGPRGREPSRRLEEVASVVAKDLCRRVSALWRDMRAAEVVVDEVSQELAGDEPLDDDLQDLLNDMLARLEDLAAWASEFAGEVNLDDPGEEAIAASRELLLGDGQ